MNDVREVNFDGLVGPTHNYAGLSAGNIASTINQADVSSPKRAALQGLAKMRALLDMGHHQGVLVPHCRPNLGLLRSLGFSGSDTQVWESVWQTSPRLALNAISASSMWVANAATVSAGADTPDGKTHFTPANLVSMFHRSSEYPFTTRLLKTMFADEQYFAHHAALPPSPHMGDEGAANHTRLCNDHGEPGITLLVYGVDGLSKDGVAPAKFPARQTREACMALARQHGLSEQQCVFAQQSPEAIDAGVFHNDVISVGQLNVFFYHEQAFVDSQAVIAELGAKLAPTELVAIEVPAAKVSLQDAVKSYLFNTQLVRAAGESASTIVAPGECQEIESVHQFLEELKATHPAIADVRYFDLRESMKNGGGPACLRLRVPLSQQQRDSIRPKVLLDEARIGLLENWVSKHYPDELAPADLRDPAIIVRTQTALDELTALLELGSLYDFQR